MKKRDGSGDKIKAIVFDIGGVLFLGDKVVKYGHQNINVHEFLAKKFDLKLKEWFDLIEKDYYKAITGEEKKDMILKKLSNKLNYSPEKLEKLFVKAHKKYFRKNKGLFNFAKKLRKKDYLVSVLSDQTYFSKKAIITKKDFYFFESIVLSCDIGLRKPDKKIYKYFKKKMNEKNKVSYGEMVFIDNREWNLKPAKELGMKTIHYKNNKQTIKELNKLLKKQAV